MFWGETFKEKLDLLSLTNIFCHLKGELFLEKIYSNFALLKTFGLNFFPKVS